jgi:hypothetical protein
MRTRPTSRMKRSKERSHAEKRTNGPRLEPGPFDMFGS